MRSLLKERDKLTTSLGCALSILLSLTRHRKGAQRARRAEQRRRGLLVPLPESISNRFAPIPAKGAYQPLTYYSHGRAADGSSEKGGLRALSRSQLNEPDSGAGSRGEKKGAALTVFGVQGVRDRVRNARWGLGE